MRLFFHVLLLLLLSGIAANAQQSINISFSHSGKTVFGTFSTPAGPGPFPTVIINPGSGANDRDGTLPLLGGNAACLYPALLGDTLRPYRGLATALVDSGFAVLRYDKIEYTYTTPGGLGPITFGKLWLPVQSALEYVKTRPDVDTNRIVLLGHSEGSSIIPYIAQGRTDVRALISLAGPRTPFDSLLAYQLVHIAQTCGGNVALAQTQANQILGYYQTIRTNTWNAATPALFGVPAAVWYDYVRVTDSVAHRYNANDLPTLFVGLGADINVPPAELVRFQNEITIEADFYSLPGLNHYLSTNDDPQVSAVPTDTIVYWLRQQGFFPSSVHPASGGSHRFELFPNPAFSRTAIRWTDPAVTPDAIAVENCAGQTVVRQLVGRDSREISLDLAGLPAGVYFVRVFAGNRMAVRPLIKRSQ